MIQLVSQLRTALERQLREASEGPQKGANGGKSDYISLYIPRLKMKERDRDKRSLEDKKICDQLIRLNSPVS